jgi:hypothetical protein
MSQQHRSLRSDRSPHDPNAEYDSEPEQDGELESGFYTQYESSDTPDYDPVSPDVESGLHFGRGIDDSPDYDPVSPTIEAENEPQGPEQEVEEPEEVDERVQPPIVNENENYRRHYSDHGAVWFEGVLFFQRPEEWERFVRDENWVREQLGVPRLEHEGAFYRLPGFRLPWAERDRYATPSRPRVSVPSISDTGSNYETAGQYHRDDLNSSNPSIPNQHIEGWADPRYAPNAGEYIRTIVRG